MPRTRKASKRRRNIGFAPPYGWIAVNVHGVPAGDWFISADPRRYEEDLQRVKRIVESWNAEGLKGAPFRLVELRQKKDFDEALRLTKEYHRGRKNPLTVAEAEQLIGRASHHMSLASQYTQSDMARPRRALNVGYHAGRADEAQHIADAYGTRRNPMPSHWPVGPRGVEYGWPHGSDVDDAMKLLVKQMKRDGVIKRKNQAPDGMLPTRTKTGDYAFGSGPTGGYLYVRKQDGDAVREWFASNRIPIDVDYERLGRFTHWPHQSAFLISPEFLIPLLPQTKRVTQADILFSRDKPGETTAQYRARMKRGKNPMAKKQKIGKIPGLRSWSKAKGGRGNRDGYRYKMRSFPGIEFFIFPHPNKKSAGPITSYYITDGMQTIAKGCKTKTDCIKAAKRFAKTRTNPLTRAEAAEVRRNQRTDNEIHRDEQLAWKRYEESGEHERAASAAYGAGLAGGRADTAMEILHHYGPPEHPGAHAQYQRGIGDRPRAKRRRNIAEAEIDDFAYIIIDKFGNIADVFFTSRMLPEGADARRAVRETIDAWNEADTKKVAPYTIKITKTAAEYDAAVKQLRESVPGPQGYVAATKSKIKIPGVRSWVRSSGWVTIRTPRGKTAEIYQGWFVLPTAVGQFIIAPSKGTVKRTGKTRRSSLKATITAYKLIFHPNRSRQTYLVKDGCKTKGDCVKAAKKFVRSGVNTNPLKPCANPLTQNEQKFIYGQSLLIDGMEDRYKLPQRAGEAHAMRDAAVNLGEKPIYPLLQRDYEADLHEAAEWALPFARRPWARGNPLTQGERDTLRDRRYEAEEMGGGDEIYGFAYQPYHEGRAWGYGAVEDIMQPRYGDYAVHAHEKRRIKREELRDMLAEEREKKWEREVREAGRAPSFFVVDDAGVVIGEYLSSERAEDAAAYAQESERQRGGNRSFRVTRSNPLTPAEARSIRAHASIAGKKSKDLRQEGDPLGAQYHLGQSMAYSHTAEMYQPGGGTLREVDVSELEAMEGLPPGRNPTHGESSLASALENVSENLKAGDIQFAAKRFQSDLNFYDANDLIPSEVRNDLIQARELLGGWQMGWEGTKVTRANVRAATKLLDKVARSLRARPNPAKKGRKRKKKLSPAQQRAVKKMQAGLKKWKKAKGIKPKRKTAKKKTASKRKANPRIKRRIVAGPGPWQAETKIAYPEGVFTSRKAAVLDAQRSLKAKYGTIRKAPYVKRAVWKWTSAKKDAGRWHFTVGKKQPVS